MSDLNIAVYAGAALGESQIVTNLAATKQAGWTTVILGLFHIGYPPDWPEAKIFFNDTGVVDGGRYLADPGWPDNVAQLKQNSPKTRSMRLLAEAVGSRTSQRSIESIKRTTIRSAARRCRKTSSPSSTVSKML